MSPQSKGGTYATQPVAWATGTVWFSLRGYKVPSELSGPSGTPGCFWPTLGSLLMSNTQQYITGCALHHRCKQWSGKRIHLLPPLSIAKGHCQRLGIDFTTNLPISEDGYDWIVMISPHMTNRAQWKHQQNVYRSESDTQYSQTLRLTSALLRSTSRCSQTPLQICNVLSDCARAFWRCSWTHLQLWRWIQDATRFDL